MGQLMSREEQTLDGSLKALLIEHGYEQVLSRLVQIARVEPSQPAGMPSARYLMTLTPEEREPFLKAAVEDALSLYEADRARPKAESELTVDLETGDFHEYGDEDHA